MIIHYLDSVLVEFFRNEVMSSFTELMNDTKEAFVNKDTLLRLKLNESQSSEKRWKQIVENNEM